MGVSSIPPLLFREPSGSSESPQYRVVLTPVPEARRPRTAGLRSSWRGCPRSLKIAPLLVGAEAQVKDCCWAGAAACRCILQLRDSPARELESMHTNLALSGVEDLSAEPDAWL